MWPRFLGLASRLVLTLACACCSYYYGYEQCMCMYDMMLQWDSSDPANRGMCAMSMRAVDYGLILPVALCGALVVVLLGVVAWLWVSKNRERLAKMAGPPGA